MVLVGAAGFEPTTTRTPSEYATGLRYAPTYHEFTGVSILPWQVIKGNGQNGLLSRMRVDDLEDGLKVTTELLGHLFGRKRLRCRASPPHPISLHPFQGMAFFIEHSLDFQHSFDIPLHIQALIAAAFLRL
jgi:hypothetical protein